MIQIAPGLYGFTGLLAGRVYAIVDPDGLTLVDAGLKLAATRVVGQIERQGRTARDVKRILVTHAHPDHVGGLPRLKELTGAVVYCSERERPVVEGREPIPRPPRQDRRGLSRWLSPPSSTLPGTPVDRTLADGEAVPEAYGGLRAIATPGHAPGHLAYWHPDGRVLFCGDALMNLFGLRPPFGPFTVDQAEAHRSIRRIASLEPELVLFGHGRPLHAAAPRLHALAARLA
jgi:glyoxylase-like metal-dependent hydrolase (beta-lactamase superfamily II)